MNNIELQNLIRSLREELLLKNLDFGWSQIRHPESKRSVVIILVELGSTPSAIPGKRYNRYNPFLMGEIEYVLM
jgi:hypothetical protein